MKFTRYVAVIRPEELVFLLYYYYFFFFFQNGDHRVLCSLEDSVQTPFFTRIERNSAN